MLVVFLLNIFLLDQQYNNEFYSPFQHIYSPSTLAI